MALEDRGIFGYALQQAAACTFVIVTEAVPQDLPALGRFLYALLLMLLSGALLEIVAGVDQHHGFESWRKVVNNNVSAADRKKQNSQTLRGLYVENDQAMKNLRGNVWPIISSRIIGIDPTKDVMFNVVHGSVSNESPDSYLISFRNKLTSEVSPVEGKEMITSIYSPRRTIRRVK